MGRRPELREIRLEGDPVNSATLKDRALALAPRWIKGTTSTQIFRERGWFPVQMTGRVTQVTISYPPMIEYQIDSHYRPLGRYLRLMKAEEKQKRVAQSFPNQQATWTYTVMLNGAVVGKALTPTWGRSIGLYSEATQGIAMTNSAGAARLMVAFEIPATVPCEVSS